MPDLTVFKQIKLPGPHTDHETEICSFYIDVLLKVGNVAYLGGEFLELHRDLLDAASAELNAGKFETTVWV